MKNHNDIINAIKILIYKENPSLLEIIKFEDDTIFLEPLLFSYFNSQKDKLFSNNMLSEIMQGYFIEKKEEIIVNESINKQGNAYIPNLGYFNSNGLKTDDFFKIENTSIELILQPIVLLNHIFKDLSNNTINENKIEISKALFNRYEKPLTNAFQYIKNSTNEHFELIQKCCKKIVLFKTNPKNTNSFATINAHGIAFLNVYQDDYDEVFFVDDIAHQTGHIIMTTILFNRKDYFLIDENTNIRVMTKVKSEYRSFYILFHALYTYYTTLLCLDACLDKKLFNKRQIHEAKGRIGFYLLKCKSDLLNFEKVINYNKIIENVLSKDGIEIYEKIENKYCEILKKYNQEVAQFNFKNQPYNFTYSSFIKLNPLFND